MNTDPTVRYPLYWLRRSIAAYISSVTGWPVNFSICWTCMSSAAWRPRSVNCGRPVASATTSATTNMIPTGFGWATTASKVRRGEVTMPMARANRPSSGAGGATLGSVMAGNLGGGRGTGGHLFIVPPANRLRGQWGGRFRAALPVTGDS